MSMLLAHMNSVREAVGSDAGSQVLRAVSARRFGRVLPGDAAVRAELDLDAAHVQIGVDQAVADHHVAKDRGGRSLHDDRRDHRRRRWDNVRIRIVLPGRGHQRKGSLRWHNWARRRRYIHRAAAGERAVGRVRGSQRLIADRVERGSESPRAACQRLVARQDCRAVAAGEVDGPRIACDRVVVGIFGRDRKRERVARGRLAGAEIRNCDAAAAVTLTVPLAPVSSVGGVGGCDRLVRRRLESESGTWPCR